jgi:hypothetical protein
MMRAAIIFASVCFLFISGAAAQNNACNASLTCAAEGGTCSTANPYNKIEYPFYYYKETLNKFDQL